MSMPVNDTNFTAVSKHVASYTEAADHVAKLVKVMRLYAAPVLTIACLAGASLILYSAIKKRRTLQPKHYVLVVLTIADLVTILSSVFFNQFLYYGLQFSMPHVSNNAACKLWSLLWIVGNGLSANLLCFLAIDRLYAVSRPLQHRVSTSRGRYCLLLGVFCAPFLAVGIFGIVEFRIYKYLDEEHCYMDITAPNGLVIAYQAYATLVANGTLGSCFLLVANAVLACRLCSIARSRRASWRQQQRQQQRQDIASRGSQPMENFTRLEISPVRETPPNQTKNYRHRQTRPRPRESTAAVRTGVTLMAASAAHLVGSLPRAVTYLIVGIIEYSGYADASELVMAEKRLMFELGALFDYLFYANCSLNWLIYCINVPDLRPW